MLFNADQLLGDLYINYDHCPWLIGSFSTSVSLRGPQDDHRLAFTDPSRFCFKWR
jgi:hypothetical protein